MSTCFVIQGFGKKTDYTDGRVLNLDASYEVIKQGVVAAGLECIRADEIQHSTVIDVPMYEMLLQADVVIADLSTYNVNAAYELGVRYALRPRTTIVVAEEGFKNPFDFGHIALRRYKHSGDDIGFGEAMRFINELKTAIQEILSSNRSDSPVYTYLPQLAPPKMPVQAPPPPAPPPAFAAPPMPRGGPVDVAAPAASPPGFDHALAAAPGLEMAAPPEPVATAKEMLDEALAMINPPEGGASDFAGARALLLQVIKVRPNDPFVTQQLVVATYKAKQPDPENALLEARSIMEQSLDPATTNDPESLGLWGAIHKRLWEIKSRPDDLNAAVDGYERGFSLRRDWYNGINYAFLLDLRALEWLKAGKKDDAIADAVLARRVRTEVSRLALAPAEDKNADPKKRFWAVATLWEAALGRGDTAEAERWGTEAEGLNVPQWMQETRLDQGRKLLALQKEFATRSAP
ncbi:MAG TPA: TRAFs-binding domain-containing protein [Azonexus sp.]|mgnify:CR=1 FL=1|nr:TRAFs-binding domain-containing protein [Azonexus sp.]